MGKDAKGKGKGKTRAKRVFERFGSSADAELVIGVWPAKSLCRFRQGCFSLLDKMELFLSSLGQFPSFSLPTDFFSAFDFSIGEIEKNFHVGIFTSA